MRSLLWCARAVVVAACLTPAANGAPTSSADEVRSVVAEMLADARTRSNLLVGTGSVDAGAGGFRITSAEGDFSLRIGGYTQFRYFANVRDDEGGAVDDFTPGFKVQRTRLIFAGRAHDSVDFLLLPFAGPTGNWGLLDAWARFDLGDGWKLQLGQFKLPFWREWLISERYILPVERSELAAVYASIYAQGAMLHYQNDDWRFQIAFSDGLRTLNADFNSAAEADYAFTARAEWLVDGEWARFTDPTALHNTDDALMLGIAAHYQGETPSFRGVNVDELFQIAADLSYESTDWSVMVAGLGRRLEVSGAPTEETYGLLAQGGVFVGDKTELFGRYELLIPDGSAAGDDAFNAVTVGVNHYLHGHALKLTADVIYFANNTGGTTIVGFGPDNGSGLLPSNEDGQFTIRLQFQLIF